MTPETVRETLNKWIAKRIRIDYWGLNAPQSIRDFSKPPSSGLDLKISEYSLVQTLGYDSSSAFQVSATIPFIIKFRFDNSYQFEQIPRGKAENLLLKILTEIKTKPCIAPDFVKVEPSGSVTVQEESKSDWLLIFDIKFRVTFHCEYYEIQNIDEVFT